MSPNAYVNEKMKNLEDFILRKYIKLFLKSFENEFKEEFNINGIPYDNTKPILNKILLSFSKRLMNHVQNALGKHEKKIVFQELEDIINTTLKTLMFENTFFSLEY